MYLPHDILYSIFGTLDGSDLKSTRLVSQTWRACASVFLFREIHVSSAKEDLDIFQKVAQDPLLNKYVWHLKYDATQFVRPITKQQYIQKLYSQTRWKYYCGTTSWKSDDSEVDEWMNDVLSHRLSEHDAVEKFKTYRFIQWGYHLYQKQASFQHAVMSNGKFLEGLTQGLVGLQKLRSVIFEVSWNYESRLGDRRCGSYFARHWPYYYSCPDHGRMGIGLHANHISSRSELRAPDGVESVRAITHALSQAGSQITSFDVVNPGGCSPPGLSPSFFGMSEFPTRLKSRDLEMAIGAMSHLERCVLHFASCMDKPFDDPSTPEQFPSLAGLQAMLNSMECLRHLELRFPDEYTEQPRMYNVNEILPRGKIWPSMRSLILVSVTATAEELLNIILCHTPDLRSLGIGNINLADGSWEDFFEALAQSKKLVRLRFERCGYLFHRNGEIFPLYDGIENYVVSGGRSPCLADDEPNSAAGKFLPGFVPTIQNRLALRGPRSWLELVCWRGG
ncbi:hypothetical protein ACLMJK_001990 [Lecanora helva]